MLIIRFSRIGKKNHAQFKIVLAEKSSPIKGKSVETLGSYDPHLKNLSLKKERVEYWISQGVSFSDSVFNLLIARGIIKGKKRPVIIKAKAKEAAPEKGGEKEPAKAETASQTEVAPQKEEQPVQENKEEKKVEEEKKPEEKPAEEKPEIKETELKKEPKAEEKLVEKKTEEIKTEKTK